MLPSMCPEHSLKMMPDIHDTLELSRSICENGAVMHDVCIRILNADIRKLACSTHEEI